jgi:ATP-binding cassette, subfamily C, bacterial
MAKLVRTPTILQMEAVECGAAALATILSYYGRVVPLAKLREECGVSRDGVNAWSILKVAKHYGLEAKGLKLSLESLKTQSPPYIVFWNFNHFLVVEGFSQKRVYLNDPNVGRRTVSLQVFNQSYTGVALVMKPGTMFQPGGQKRNSIIALGTRLKHSWGTVLFCLLAGLLLTMPRLVAPTFSQVLVDEILVQERYHWLRPLLLGMGLTAVLHWFLAKLRLNYLRRLMVKLSTALSAQFFWHILRLPVGFYAQRYAGEVSSRLVLNDRVADVLSGRLATTAIDTIMMVFYLLIMIQYDGTLTAIALCFATINILALRWFSQSRVDTNLRVAQEYGKVGGVTVSGIQSIETVKASGLESDLFSRFVGHYARAINVQQELGLQTQILTTLPTLLTALAVASILVVGGLKVMDGHLSIGMLVAYQSLTLSFLAPTHGLVNFGNTLQELEADLDRLDDVLQNPIDPETTQDEDSEQLIAFSSPLQGEIELRSLTFGYSQVAPPLIQDFNLTAKPGQRIAIVGKSGSGKSTIAKLICGLYQPWQGDIYVDGVSRRQVPRAVLANAIAIVEQDVFLFSGTVRDNLTLWDRTIPESELMLACQDAAISDLIKCLPGKFEAQLSEAGMNLSGGQRQRLEIARALVRHPAILVLDEATSALDPETERAIEQNLRRRGCTCIIIAHRLSTIRDCDEIIVLEGGKVVQRGTHAALWQQGGAYLDLIRTEEV